MAGQSWRRLPQDLAPSGERCITLVIPDSDEWERAAFSELSRLAIWSLWERDAGKHGKPVADIWRAALLTWGRCPAVVPQTLIEFDDLCGLKWSYDGGDTWTSISMAVCADSEILSRITFQVFDGDLQVSLDGGAHYASICDVANVADAEIASRIHFRTADGQLEVSFDNMANWASVYDGKGIADAEIVNQLSFRKANMDLYVSKDGGETETLIYPFDFILQAYQGKLQASIDQGETFTDIMDVKGIADTEIENQISFTQDGLQLYASLDGVTSQLIYDPGGQPSPHNAPPEEDCAVYHVHLTANNVWRCPVAVSTGMMIIITSASGGWTDGSGVGAGGPWFCPNGDSFAFNACQGPGWTDASDPYPSAYHMQLIGLLDTTYFDPFSSYSVPEGVVNAPLVFFANDGNLTDNLGSVDFDVTLCNGLTSDFIWQIDAPEGHPGGTIEQTGAHSWRVTAGHDESGYRVAFYENSSPKKCPSFANIRYYGTTINGPGWFACYGGPWPNGLSYGWPEGSSMGGLSMFAGGPFYIDFDATE